jgi:hypothetical protein
MAAEGTLVSKGNLEVRFDDKSRAFVVFDREAGVLLDRIVVRARVGGREVATDVENPTSRVNTDPDQGELAIALSDDFVLRLRVNDDGQFEARTNGKADGPVSLSGRATSPHAMIALLEEDRKNDQGVLVTTLGPAQVSKARSLFDPQNDLAMTAGPAGRAYWQPMQGWELRSKAPAGETLLSLKVRRHYYRDELKIAQYAPITKRRRWQTAPIVAMTWYGIQGWKGKPAQTKEWLYPNVDWVARHLLPYAETLVFQLDDNYYTDNDPYMRDISDYIRSKGLVPGIWFTPFTVAPTDVTDQHPDWFIHDKDGKPISTFGGVSYPKHFTLNVTNPEAVNAWFGMWWRKASATWNFDFFKIDGQPQVIDAYKKATDGGGVEGYRKGLAIGREIVGPEKFINGCWGIPLEAIGRLDGSRTGGDTGNQAHAIDIILKWNFLNNVCWWSDPDAAANLYKATVERARLNAQARVLTGQQFLTDDVWTSVPAAIRRVWQLAYPTLDIRPVNLYPIDQKEHKRYDLFDLRIAKPWGTWDVVGLFNYDGRAAAKTLDLARLPLEADEVHVFEFWKSLYLGKFKRDAKIERALAAHEGELFSITPVPADDRPVLISSSRHASQGGLDLDGLSWEQSGRVWTAKGKSSHLVAGDSYELVFSAGAYAIASADCPSGATELAEGGGVSRVRIVPKDKAASWEVGFEPRTKPHLDVAPTVLRLHAESKAAITILNLGPQKLGWEAGSSDPRIRVSPNKGDLAGWPDAATVAVSADASGLAPGETWNGRVTVEAQGAGGSPRAVEIHLQVPPPENLARSAKAKASSVWAKGYEASKVNDGDSATRWNSGKSEKEGCWIELDWDTPVTFDRIVIDEVIEFGGRIEQWKLEAGADQLEEIARGTGMGLGRTVDLAKPIEAKRLRLTIEKAVQTPTVREIEVYRLKMGTIRIH